MKTPPSRPVLFQYSFLALPLAFAGLPLYIHVPDFYTRELGLSLGLMGSLLLVIRLFDALQDPLIGYIADKYNQRYPAIMAGGVAMLIAGMAANLFGPPAQVPVSLWFALSMMLATTGFSILTITLNMIGGFWRSEPEQRTRISAWREAFALTGLLIAAVLPTLLQSIISVADSLRMVFLVFATLIAIAASLFFRFMKSTPLDSVISGHGTQQGLSCWVILTGANRHFFTVCFLTYLAAAVPGVLVLFFIRDYLSADKLAGLFLCCYFISGAILLPAWVKLATHIGKEKAWLLSMLLSVVTFLWAYHLQPGDVVAYAIICLLAGMALGADLAFPPAILADRITRQQTQAEASQHYALMTLLTKVAIAVASGLSFLALDFIGFTAGKDHSPEALQGLLILYALLPCFIKLCAAFYLWYLLKQEHDKPQQQQRTPV